MIRRGTLIPRRLLSPRQVALVLLPISFPRLLDLPCAARSPPPPQAPALARHALHHRHSGLPCNHLRLYLRWSMSTLRTMSSQPPRGLLNPILASWRRTPFGALAKYARLLVGGAGPRNRPSTLSATTFRARSRNTSSSWSGRRRSGGDRRRTRSMCTEVCRIAPSPETPRADS